MSSTLYMYPARRKGIGLAADVKFALRKKYGDIVCVVLTESEVPYLQGLRDGGTEGAQALIDFIDKHGEVLVKEEY